MSVNLRIRELVCQVENESIKRQVFDQLVKDFTRSGIQLTLNDNSTTQQWIEELVLVLNKLYHNNSTQLFQLLYLIDVPQEYYSNTQEIQKEDFGIFFAKLILMRTLKKIAYRNQYS